MSQCAIMYPPGRIVCLTEETVETLYLLGQQERIVGVSGYVVRPPEARRDKPRISSFLSADLPKILALEPDLVLAFSDLQAEIVAGLIKAGVAVHAFNQRSVAEILDMVRLLGAMTGQGAQSERLAQGFEAGLQAARDRAYGTETRGYVLELCACGSRSSGGGQGVGHVVSPAHMKSYRRATQRAYQSKLSQKAFGADRGADIRRFEVRGRSNSKRDNPRPGQAAP